MVGLRGLKASHRTTLMATIKNTAIDMPNAVPLYHLSEVIVVAVGVGVA